MDLLFISGDFLQSELPKEKAYLYRYFDTVFQRKFVEYVYAFGDSEFFREHTGISCTDRLVYRLDSRLQDLLDSHKDAKDRMDFAVLEDIEKGRHLMIC